MKRRCSPRFVQKAHSQARSWRKAARMLNELYGVTLSHLTWRDYATGRRDIAAPSIRAALGLGPRVCPVCGQKPTAKFSRLLAKMTPAEWIEWRKLRKLKKYKAANRLLEEVYRRTSKRMR